jgi:hypothetical protein
VLIVAALVVAGWLAFSLRALHLEDEAQSLVPPPPARASAADLERMEELLEDAAKGNPDIRPDVALAFQLGVIGESRRSIALAEDVLRREPDNLRAASILHVQLERTDPEAAAAVERQIRRIAPPVE